MKKLFLTTGLVLITILSFTGCSKENEPITLKPQVSKANSLKIPTTLGYSAVDGKPIMGTVSITEGAEGKIRMEARSDKGNKGAAIEFVLGDSIYIHQDYLNTNLNDPETLYRLVTEGVLTPQINDVGDIETWGFIEGECDWCECVSGIMGSDPTGGAIWMVYGAACPQCAIIMGAGIAAYCAGSAMNSLING
jgi:hypothetical protein